MDGHKITSQGFTGRTFTISSGASITVYGNGEIYSDSYGAFDVYGELTVENGYYHAKGYDDNAGSGAVLRTRPGSSLIIKDGVSVFSNAGGAVYAEGYLNAGNCSLVSQSHNGLKTSTGLNLYTYCVQVLGTGEFTNTTIQGVQGGLYAGGKVTINSGTYTAAELNDGSYTGKKAFYALYISNNAEVVINGGTFNAGSYDYCIQNSDNDVGMAPSDKIVIHDGIFNGVVGTKIDSFTNVDAFTINGGKYSDIINGTSSLSERIPDDKRFTFSDGYYILTDVISDDLGTAMPFRTTDASQTVGYYFDIETTIPYVTSNAAVTLSSESENKTLESTLVLPTMSGDGAVSISLLVLNAPSDLAGTIEFE